MADSADVKGDIANKTAEQETSQNNGATTETENAVDVKTAEQKEEKKETEDTGAEKTGGRQHNERSRGSNRARNMSNYDNLPETDDAGEIRKQVEFYFSDANLPNDAHLLKMTGAHENKPVDLKMIHQFKRMRRFNPFSAVRDALKTSTMLEINDKDQVFRKVPLDKKWSTEPSENAKLHADATLRNSIYVKGLGKEYDHLQLDLEKYFKPYGPVSSVRLRRYEKGAAFKGSAFICFASEDLAKQFLSLEEKPTWSALQEDGEKVDADLIFKSKEEYVTEKEKELKAKGITPGKGSRAPYDGGHRNGGRRGGGNRGSRGGGRGHRGRDDRRDRNRSGRDDTKEGAEGDGSKKRSREDDTSDSTAKKQKQDAAAEA